MFPMEGGSWNSQEFEEQAALLGKSWSLGGLRFEVLRQAVFWDETLPFHPQLCPAAALEINEFPVPAHRTPPRDAPTDNLSLLAPATKERARSDPVQRCNHPSPSCPGWEPSRSNPGILSSLGLGATSSHCWLLPTCYLSEIPCISLVQPFWSRLAAKAELDFFVVVVLCSYIVLGMLWKKVVKSKSKVGLWFCFYIKRVGFFKGCCGRKLSGRSKSKLGNGFYLYTYRYISFLCGRKLSL